MPGKLMTEEGLQKDLSYVQRGIYVHSFLASLAPPYTGMNVLEPGCGSGKLGIWYALRGANVTLLDIDIHAIRYAEELWERAYYEHVPRPASPTNATFKIGSIHRLPSTFHSYYDLVFNEGVPQAWGFNPKDWRRQHAINEMARAAKKNGVVCVVGSNAHCSQTMQMANETDHTYPGMPPREKPFTKEDIVTRLLSAGLTMVNAQPLGNSWEDALLLAGWGYK